MRRWKRDEGIAKIASIAKIVDWKSQPLHHEQNLDHEAGNFTLKYLSVIQHADDTGSQLTILAMLAILVFILPLRQKTRFPDSQRMNPPPLRPDCWPGG
jgi:hypothetical protein